MALIKEVIPGEITVSYDATVGVREDTVITEDGVEISRTYHRTVLSPGEDVSNRSKLVQDITKLVWTPEVIAVWKEKREADLKKLLASLKPPSESFTPIPVPVPPVKTDV